MTHITIDKGVPLPDGAKRGSIYAKYRDTLLNMDIGDSIFEEGKTVEDAAGLIRYAKKMDTHLQAFDTDEDELMLLPGVRIWRVSPEDLPGRKSAAVKEVEQANDTYWVNRKTEELMVCPEGGRPEGKGFVQITLIEHTALGSKYLVAITARRNFEAEQAELEKTQGNYWKDPEGLVVIEWLPGRYPETKDNKVRATREEYKAFQERQKPVTKPKKPAKIPPPDTFEAKPAAPVNTYWMRADGSCVEVPPEKLELAKKTKGAIQINKKQYDAWVDENTI